MLFPTNSAYIFVSFPISLANLFPSPISSKETFISLPALCSAKTHMFLYTERSTSLSPSALYIASKGHAEIHWLHAVHFSFISAILSFMSIASKGHALIHNLQPLHLPLITITAILLSS
jgi:hypothetical protein